MKSASERSNTQLSGGIYSFLLAEKNMRSRRSSTRASLQAAISFTVEALESRQLLSGSISGTVFNDINGNGAMLPGSGIAGAQVYLDLQGIDKFVAGDPVATTDGAGNYGFTGLAAANYLVRPVPVAGKVITAPIFGGKYFVQLGANQNVTGDTFGVQAARTPNFTLNGQLLVAGTSGSQQTLTRYNADTSTDVSFGSLGVVTLPVSVSGQPTSAVAQGGNTVITYPAQTVTLDNLGNVVSITNNGNGSTPNAPTNLTATAISPTSVQLGFTDNSTNDTGFVIQRRSPGAANFVTVGTISGSVTGPSTGFVGFADNNVLPNSTYSYIVYAVNGTAASSAAGPTDVLTPNGVATGASISGTVHGNNGNVQVYLDLNGSGAYVSGDPIITTDAQGKYSFSGLNPGNYLVRIVPQSGWFTVNPVYGGKYFVQLAANQTVNGDDFSVVSLPSFKIGSQYLAYGISASTGNGFLERFNADASTDVTFGGLDTALGVVNLPATVVGNPSSAAVQSDGKIVVTYPGSVVTLSATGIILSIAPGTGQTLNAPSGLTATATSPASVRIAFMDNSTNEDTFVLERSSSAAGPFVSIANIGGFGGGGGVTGTGPVVYSDSTVQPNTTYYYRVYGITTSNVQSPIAGPASVTTPSVGTGGATIAGTVYSDINGDNSKNPFTTLAGAQVYLDLQGLDRLVAGDPVATADINGKYIFTGLTPGNYLVRPVLPAGDVITGPLFGGKYFVQLAANQNVTGDDFSLYPVPSTQFVVNGQLIVAPVVLNQSTLRRFNADGAVDVTFGTYGTVTLPPSVTGNPSSITAQPNGNLVATYFTSVATLSPSGTVLSVTPTTGQNINAPTGLTATATSPTTVQLTFTDNSTNETSFHIERSTSPAGPFDASLVVYSNGPGTGTVSTVDVVSPNTTYYYRVYAAIDSAGSVVARSASAGPVSVTTPATVGVAGIYGTVSIEYSIGGAATALAGTQVYLDLQGTGHFVSGDPVATTDANGKYSFVNVAAGNYSVRVVPVQDRFVVSPTSGGARPVQLPANQASTGNDFTILGSHQYSLNGKFYAAIYINNTNLIYRFNADQTLDTTFGNQGVVDVGGLYNNSISYQSVTEFVAGPNGTIVIPMYYGNVYVVLSSSGVLQSVNLSSLIATGVTATADTPTSVQVSFNVGIPNAGGYEVDRSSSPNGPFALIDIVTATPDGLGNGIYHYVDNSVSPGTTYYYAVAPYAKQYDESAAVAVTTPNYPNLGTSISGKVFFDTKISDGIPNFGEVGAPGRQVYLDLGGIGSYVSGDPIVTTDASGQYSFTGLQPGSYVVRVTPQTGSYIDAPLFGGKYYVQLTASQSVRGENFGIVPITADVSLTQPNGEILIGSGSNLYRLNPDTSSDVTFGNSGGGVRGKVTLPFVGPIYIPRNYPDTSTFGVRNIALRSDDGIYVSYFGSDLSSGKDAEYLSLLDSLGNVVSTIPDGGGNLYGAVTTETGLQILTGGKVLVSGVTTVPATGPDSVHITRPILNRYNADLTPDPTFNYPADSIFGTPNGVAVQADGTLLVVLPNDSVKLTATGALDASRVLPVATDVTAAPTSATTVTIQFTDNSTAEQFYEVESSTSGTGDWKLKGTVQGSASTGQRLFTVADAIPGQLTYYRVRAVNGAVESNPSAVVAATTPAMG
jgi:uncharacterized delta-60 repeat protein